LSPFHSAIIFAANNGHLELLKALIEVGANKEDRSNNWRTPLNWAAHWGHYECVEYLVGAGANISTFDSKGMTPLMSATLNGNARVVQFLLDHGANPLSKNVYNGTALTMAQVQNNTVLISLLEPYYPEETSDSSPYVIMYNIVVTEIGELADLFYRETLRLCAEAEVVARHVHAEVIRRWEQYQEDKLKARGEGAVARQYTVPEPVRPFEIAHTENVQTACNEGECSASAVPANGEDTEDVERASQQQEL
jgi:hypothetical protein